MSQYGYCPKCGSKGVGRERRPNGNDTCAEGHEYPSSEARKSRKEVTREFKKGDAVLIPAEIIREEDGKFLVGFLSHGGALHNLWMSPAQLEKSSG